MPAILRSLISLASTGRTTGTLGYEKSVKGMMDLETKLMNNCQHSGISSDIYVYQMLEAFNAKANGLRAVDPGLLPLHAMDDQAPASWSR